MDKWLQLFNVWSEVTYLFPNFNCLKIYVKFESRDSYYEHELTSSRA